MFDDAYTPPPSHKQRQYAVKIAATLGETLPREAQADRASLSEWIDARVEAFKAKTAASKARFGASASAKQVAFAERLGRMKMRSVPDECFRSKDLMSKWIDANR